jgi:hypothetical protein
MIGVATSDGVSNVTGSLDGNANSGQVATQPITTTTTTYSIDSTGSSMCRTTVRFVGSKSGDPDGGAVKKEISGPSALIP